MIIVYTYGVFDLLHPGHIKLLTRARSLGNKLFVGIISDKQTKEAKGENRPIQNEKDRAYIVNSLKVVDEVFEQETYDPSIILSGIKAAYPECDLILTKGDDWENIPGTEAVEKLGGKLVKLPYSPEYSTSSTIERINTKW